MTSIKLKTNERGFVRGDFLDANGQPCSIQESSVADEDLLWLGCDSGQHTQGLCLARMHLDKRTAKRLIALLQLFVDTGGLQ